VGTTTQPAAVKLLIAVLFHPNAPVEKILDAIDRRFGKRQHTYGPVPFSWTRYYREEMGSDLQKLYYNYETSIDRSDIPDIKLFTNDIERRYSTADGNRTVNIDPGYVARDKVVLATTKDFYHRLYLDKGIFGEVTLHYRKGRFRYFSWTYPDFKDQNVMLFLEKIRAPLVKQIRTQESS
jgi:hypothetical protein